MDIHATRKSAILARFPEVYPILDTGHLESTGQRAVDFAEAVSASGFGIAQYRHKGDFTRDRYEEATAVGAILRKSGTCFIVNDRADIAMAIGADGVHVGQDDLPVGLVRRLVGEGMIVGYSTHNASQVAATECECADYLAIGPVFGTASKPNPDPTVGLNGIKLARSLTDKALVAIGGITLGNAEDAYNAGADSLSMISSIGPESFRAWAACGR